MSTQTIEVEVEITTSDLLESLGTAINQATEKELQYINNELDEMGYYLESSLRERGYIHEDDISEGEANEVIVKSVVKLKEARAIDTWKLDCIMENFDKFSQEDFEAWLLMREENLLNRK